jgi:predicted Rossmann fold nucleotide-binding protein DprA/Smf involved in DNA uptake
MSSKTPTRRTTFQSPPLIRLAPDDTDYPASLGQVLGRDAPTTISTIGNLDILRQSSVALFCSIQCPGRLILETYDLAQALRDAGVTVVGGFHSPMEQECLRLLLRGRQPIVICPARSIERLRVPTEWRGALAAGRLLVLSAFDSGSRRATAELAGRRNRVVAALADEVFVAYAAPGSRTEAFAQEIAASGKPLLTLDAPENAVLISLGARPVRPASFREFPKASESDATLPCGAIPLPFL